MYQCTTVIFPKIGTFLSQEKMRKIGDKLQKYLNTNRVEYFS